MAKKSYVIHERMAHQNRELERQVRKLGDQSLLSSMDTAVQRERESTIAVLIFLREVDRRRLYAEGDTSSLLEFCMKRHGYSEHQALDRIAAMRLLKELPELEEKIESGALNLTQLGRARTFFNREARSDHEISSAEN